MYFSVKILNKITLFDMNKYYINCFYHLPIAEDKL